MIGHRIGHLRNDVTAKIRRAKKDYSSSITSSSGQSTQGWKYLNYVMPRKKNVSKIQQIKNDGKAYDGKTDISEGFNRYFSSTG